MDKLKAALSGRETLNNEDEERGFVSQALDASSLSMGTRMKGFGICFGIGVLACVLGSLSLALNPLNLKLFAGLYTIGNLMAVGSTLFLMGPMKQLTTMFAPTRVGWVESLAQHPSPGSGLRRDAGGAAPHPLLRLLVEEGRSRAHVVHQIQCPFHLQASTDSIIPLAGLW